MRVIVAFEDPALRERWRACLAAELAGAHVFAWDASAAGSGRTAATGTHAARAPGADRAPGPATSPHADYAVGWNPPAALFASQPRLKAYFQAGAGVERLLALPGLPPALPVVRVEDAGMARQMAEYCCHEVFRRYRRYGEYEAQQRDALWRGLDPPSDAPFRVGVLGLGALGEHVARTLAGFGYEVLGHARTPRGIPGVQTSSGDDALDRFLARCDVLILMLPLTARTRGIVDARALACLPRGAWLVNVARGALVDDGALLAALDDGHLAGATLDVFHTEPLPAEHPFWRHPRIRITPHVAAVTQVPESARQIAAKILRFERGEPAGGVVDRSRGY